MIKDLWNYLEKDKIKIIPLQKNRKEPKHKKFYDRNYTTKELKNHKGNYGLCVGYHHNQNNNKSIAVIDIDGIKGEYEKETQLIIFNALKDIPGVMQVRTQSGGYHLYCWNKKVLKNFHNISKSLCFPKDCSVPELQGKPLEKSIEIFTKWHTKYVVLPGSTVLNKDTGKINKYTIINNIKSFKDIATFDNIGETIKNTLLEKGFTEKPKNTTSVKEVVKNDEFGSTQIKSLITLLTSPFMKMEGSRQDCYMALGGYLINHLSEKTVKSIVFGLAQACGDDELSKRVETVTRNSEYTGAKTGLPTLLEHFEMKDFNPKKYEFLIRQIVQKDFKHYIVTETGSKRRIELEIDYCNAVISEVIYEKKTKIDEETGEKEHIWVWKTSTPVLNLRPDKIYESYNILNQNNPVKVCFRFFRKGMPYVNTLTGDDITQIENELNTRNGVVLKPFKFKGILSTLSAEYVELGLMEQKFNAPVTGLFINPITEKLVWCVNSSFECEENGLITDMETIKPSKKEVYNGLDVWSRLSQHYKGDLKKLSHIIRWGILCPFSYILKQIQSWVPMLYLYGVSDTTKTSIAEIALCLYADINDHNSLGGLAASSKYQAGETFSKTSLGCIINEPGNVLDKADILDIYKRGVESTICREKQGNNKKHERVPAYNNFIWTSNNYVPKQDAFIKRTDYLEFDKHDQVTKDDKEAFAKEFNHVNWSDTDFLLLRKVGDFIVWYVSNHLDLLMKKHKVIVDTLLDELFNYSGYECFDWIYEEAETMKISDTEESVLVELRNMILRDYSMQTKFIRENSNTILEDIEDILAKESIGIYNNNSDKRAKEFKDNMFGLIHSNRIPYLFLSNSRSDGLCVGFRSEVGTELNKFTNGRFEVTGKILAGMFNVEYTNYRSITNNAKQIKGFRLIYDEFERFLQ